MHIRQLPTAFTQEARAWIQLRQFPGTLKLKGLNHIGLSLRGLPQYFFNILPKQKYLVLLMLRIRHNHGNYHQHHHSSCLTSHLFHRQHLLVPAAQPYLRPLLLQLWFTQTLFTFPFPSKQSLKPNNTQHLFDYPLQINFIYKYYDHVIYQFS